MLPGEKNEERSILKNNFLIKIYKALIRKVQVTIKKPVGAASSREIKGGTEMTHATDDSAISTALEQIIKNGFEGLDTAVSILINEAMRIERSRAL